MRWIATRQPVGLLAVACCTVVSAARGDDYPPLTPQRHYNGIVAGEEAYQQNEARRRGEIVRQADLNADMVWRFGGLGSWYPGTFEAWPMVPGDIWGWPAAVPTLPSSASRGALRRPNAAAIPQPPRSVPRPNTGDSVPIPPPGFKPEAEPERAQIVPREVGPREF